MVVSQVRVHDSGIERPLQCGNPAMFGPRVVVVPIGVALNRRTKLLRVPHNDEQLGVVFPDDLQQVQFMDSSSLVHEADVSPEMVHKSV